MRLLEFKVWQQCKCDMNMDNFIVHVKTKNVYADLAKDVEKTIDTSNYKNSNISNIKQRNGKYYENSQISQDSGLLIKGITQTIENEIKEQKNGFIGMLLGTLAASLFENMLPSKDARRTGNGVNKAGKGTIRAEQDF